MPHERIHSLDSDPERPNNVQVAWGHPSSPSNTGPGHGNEDGHVMIVVERPEAGRMACSIEEIERRLPEILRTIREWDYAGGGEAESDDHLVQHLIKEHGEDLSYAFGSQLDLLAVTIDRKGCNKMISALRRGRDAAFGKDE